MAIIYVTEKNEQLYSQGDCAAVIGMAPPLFNYYMKKMLSEIKFERPNLLGCRPIYTTADLKNMALWFIANCKPNSQFSINAKRFLKKK